MSFPFKATTPLLSADEEVELAKCIEAGAAAQARIEAGHDRPGDHELAERGARSRRRFTEANLRLVVSIASKARIPARADREDVIQDGMIGLDRAVTKFDWRQGYKFSTYATWWIRHAIQRGLETATTVRIPARSAGQLRRALSDHDGEPTELPTKLASLAALSNLESIDRAIGEGTTIGDLVPSTAEDPAEVIEANEDRDLVLQLLGKLDPMTAQMVTARFGLDGDKPETYTSMAARLGVSAEAVRRRVNRALARLRPDAERLGVAAATPVPARLATAA